MFDPKNGEKVARRIYDEIMDVYSSSPEIDISKWDVDEWARNGEVGIFELLDVYDNIDEDNVSDLMAYVYEQSSDPDEKVGILCEGAFYKHLGAVLESIHEFG